MTIDSPHLDPEWAERYYKLAEGSFFFGTPIHDLTRDELIAMAMCGWEAQKAETERGHLDRQFLLDSLRYRA